MNYIEAIRALVGHRPLIMVVAGALIVNAHGDLLLQRRSDDGLWGIPGGSMELGETIEETLHREVAEETGLSIDRLRLFDVFSGPEMRHTYLNGDAVALVSVVYLVDQVHGAIARNHESYELRYVAAEAVASLRLSRPDLPIIRRFLDTHRELARPLP